jgi:ribose/xylose/arabinose/galactoside ABC-type transport system permease subunit
VPHALRKYANQIGLLIAIAIVLAGTALLSEAYWSPETLQLTLQMILRESAFVGILALGAATVIISGGIDLSAGSVVAFSGMLFFSMLVLFAPEDPQIKLSGKPNVLDQFGKSWLAEWDRPEGDRGPDGKLSAAELREIPQFAELQQIFPELQAAGGQSGFVLQERQFEQRDLRRLLLQEFVQRFDADRSGTLSLSELSAARTGSSEQLFSKLDENGDGQLTLAELSYRYAPTTQSLPKTTILLALAITLTAGFLIGTFHTWLITVINLPPFVATLASLVGLRSLARLMIENLPVLRTGRIDRNITINDPFLKSIGSDNWWVPCLVWLCLSGLLWVFLSKTAPGRHIYALGGNEQAARLSGIRTERLKWIAYCISSLTASLAGVFYACYITTANPSTDGMGYELNAIAAAVVGGCSLTGGAGTVLGVMLGTVFLRVVIDSVAKLFKSQPDLFEGLVVGSLVVLAVAINALRAGGGLRKQFFPGTFGLINVWILSLLGGVMTWVTLQDHKVFYGCAVAGVLLILLSAKAAAERFRERLPERR